MKLYHATPISNLASILEYGLKSSFHARNGTVDYKPAGPSVYLSRHEASSNLVTSIFCAPNDPVIVLEIDADQLDPDKMYPDDCIGAILERFWVDDDEQTGQPEKESFDDSATEFAKHFGMSVEKARDILMRTGTAQEDEIPEIVKCMTQEYMNTEGEIAYLGDVPPTCILGWSYHPHNANESLAHTTMGPTM